MTDPSPDTNPKKNSKVSLNIDLRAVILVLLLIVGSMLFAWKPWAQATGEKDDRTITVSGESKIKAEPDEFVFYPTYEFKDNSKEAALANLTKKSDEVVKKLKEIGLPENKIKTNTDGNNYPEFYPDQGGTGQNTYSLRFTVTSDNREQAQKIQDYLITTSPSGQVSPQPGFSDEKRKELESKARDEATKDARAKADQSAKNLDFKIDKVKSISDGSNFGGIQTLRQSADPTLASDTAAKPSGLDIQPGEDDLRYSVTVVYYVR